MIEEILNEIEKIDKEGVRLMEKQDASRAKSENMEKAFEAALMAADPDDKYTGRLAELRKKRQALIDSIGELTPEDRVFLARYPQRPHVQDFVSGLFTDFFKQRGDHLYDEDRSIFGGIARFHGRPVTVLGHRKGANVQENIKCNFGMPRPEGYRKALRIMDQAEKFQRPIITFVDTPGAFPGLEAEEHGQGEAIARNLAAMSSYTVPVITVVTGEGNSGGALAISVANRIIMLENAVYSVLSPEGFSSILWKDPARKAEACELMKMTAQNLYDDGIAEAIVAEPKGGAQMDPQMVYDGLDREIARQLQAFDGMTPEQIREDRYKKFRQIGVVS